MAINLGRVMRDPDDDDGFSIDWSAWLGSSATLSSVTTTPPSGLVESATTSDSTTSTHRFTGGTFGQEYDVTVTAAASDGRSKDVEVTVVVV